MATFFPDSQRTRVVFASKAEEQFYEACRRQLGSAWRVYYSCTLSSVEGGAGLRDNEIDFVLYHPRYGVIVVEVKGGQIRYDRSSSNFFSINRHGQTFSIKNPFQQVLVAKSRMIRYLKCYKMRVPVTQLVCFPTANADEFPATSGIEPELIIDRLRLANLETTLQRSVTQAQPSKFLRFADVGKDLDKVLAGQDFTTRLYFRDYIDTHEGKVRDVESMHETLLSPVAGQRWLGIEGEAGTGKTFLGVQLAKHFRNLGESVLLLSSNALLNAALARDVGSEIEVKTYAQLADEFGVDLLKPPTDFKGSTEDWTQFEAPELLSKVIAKQKNRYDVILCDEAQDVQPFWWDVIVKLLRNGEESRLFIFFDRSQGVFGSGGSDKSFVPEDVLPVSSPYMPLVNNYRTTREIADFARSFRTGQQILLSHSGRLGYLPQIITYSDERDAQRKMDRLIQRLVETEHLDPNEMTILSARKLNADRSVLKGKDSIAGLPIVDLSTSNMEGYEGIAASTISRFKGLETKIGILVNFSEYNMPLSNPIMASLAYVAATRAKHMLYVMVKEGDDKARAFHTALRKIHMSGALVIDNVSDYEFVGEVVHYNPDRVGWLNVNDERFEQGRVMFFPGDVQKANMKSIKTGDRLVFRPRLEGSMTIACDLKPA